MLKSPENFFGFRPGSDGNMIHWNDLVRYYQMLAQKTDRVRCINMGPTTMGNPFLKVIITSPENMERLEEYRKMSMLLADPRDTSEDVLTQACINGRTVCVHTMSAHASEISGAQMSPLIAYDLAVGESEDILEILKNVIFILIPCFNPDGEIMITEWYRKYRNTQHDGVDYPHLWNKYTGYDNNCDMIFENLRESQYVNQIMLREWMPQVYVDHHQMPRNWARFFIPPYKNPIRPYCSPLIWRELAFYGADMAYDLEEEGIQGVISNEYFPTCAANGYFSYPICHNIAGILTESASARFASPYYVHPESITDRLPGVFYPNPWPGGEWHFSDIVHQLYIAVRSLLGTMAKNRERILRNMLNKALWQTEAGAKNPIQAFLIPAEQHDIGCAEKLINILRKQGIELYAAAEPIETAVGVYPTGTVVVPLAQPKYALIMALLSRFEYPRNSHTTMPDGSIWVYQVISENIAGYMGVNVVEANRKITCKAADFRSFPQRKICKDILPCNENESFLRVNSLLSKGESIYRSLNGDFHVSSKSSETTKISFARTGIYQSTCGIGRLGGGNPDEGQTRLLFEQYGFPYETVGPNDIAMGMLDRLDVLIIPNYPKEDINGANKAIKDLVPEDHTWLNRSEEEKIRSFVEKGGKILALGRASEYIIDLLELKIRNRSKNMSKAEFNTGGSLLRAKVEDTPLTLGMPEECLVFHLDAPVFEITEYFKPWLYRTDLRFATEYVLQNGLCVGEKHIAGQPCLITASFGKGEVLLYGFAPQFRTQTEGTFKLIFNTLYKDAAQE